MSRAATTPVGTFLMTCHGAATAATKAVVRAVAITAGGGAPCPGCDDCTTSHTVASLLRGDFD